MPDKGIRGGLDPFGKIADLKHKTVEAYILWNAVIQFRMGEFRGKFEIPQAVTGRRFGNFVVKGLPLIGDHLRPDPFHDGAPEIVIDYNILEFDKFGMR
jgi:hypothetical protein